MNFQNLPPVPQEKELIDRSFRKARMRQKTKQEKKGTWVQGMQTKEARKLDLIRDVLVSSLERVLKSFPRVDELPKFYQELLKITLEVGQLKKSLATLLWGTRKITDFQREYVHRIMQEKDQRSMHEISRQFYGRVVSVLKQISPALTYLESCRRTMKGYPDVKEMFTVCIYGFPNVGKTTLLNLLTGTNAEVAPYAFTTKSINIGYMRMDGSKEHGRTEEKKGKDRDKDEKLEKDENKVKEENKEFSEENERKSGKKERKAMLQIVDVPGTLARQEKMNFIEMQADLVVKELANLVIYVFDYSDTSGYTVADQEKLFEQIVRGKKPALVYIAKKDITSNEVLATVREGLSFDELKEEILRKEKEIMKK